MSRNEIGLNIAPGLAELRAARRESNGLLLAVFLFSVFYNLLLFTANAGAGSSTGDTVTITREAGITDSNTNGIPDSWELKYFGNVTGAVAGADSDGDGSDNWHEFVADTNPNGSNSVYLNAIAEWTPGSSALTLEAVKKLKH